MTSKQPQILTKYRLLKKEWAELLKDHQKKVEDFPQWKSEFMQRVLDLRAAISRNDLPEWTVSLQFRISELHARMEKLRFHRKKMESKLSELNKLRTMIRNMRLKLPDGETFALPQFKCKFEQSS